MGGCPCQQVCSFLNLCAAGSKSTSKEAAAAEELSAAHRKLLAPSGSRAGDAARQQGRTLPMSEAAVRAAAHQRLADDPSSTCQVCEMAVNYVKVSATLYVRATAEFPNKVECVNRRGMQSGDWGYVRGFI